METPKCPNCGADLKAHVLGGLCPKCVLDQAAAALQQPEVAEPGSVGPVEAAEPSDRSVPRVSPPEVGTQIGYIGDYELLEEIARGGMGVVYKARQISLNRPVALKMILAGRLATEAEVKRFHTEAEAAANLDHPNIVAIYEVGHHQGQHYFSMRLVQGQNLHHQIARFAHDLRAAAQLMATVARAIHHAHQRGILHRDIKPRNILMDPTGEPHVTDFGLAKRVDLPSDLTRSETVMGTPDYMSPEQAQGRNNQLTTATDLWSLGAVLYHLLTGRAPFHRETAWETLQAVVNEEPLRPGAINRRVDRDLETICLKCLEKDTARRYASCDAFANDLALWLRNEPIMARPATEWERALKWTKRKPAIAALLAASALITALGVAGILWQLKQTEQARRLAVAREQRAQQAEEDAISRLWGSYLAQARANRLSGRPGRRFDSLDVLAKAAAIRSSLELRNEAIACLALPDVRVARRRPLKPGFGVAFDAHYQRYARVDEAGDISIRRLEDDLEMLRLATGEKPVDASLCFSPNDQFLAVRTKSQSNSLCQVWDLARREVIWHAPIPFHSAGTVFTPDSLKIAVVAEHGLLHIHPLSPGAQTRTIMLPVPAARSSFDPSGLSLALCGDQTTTVYLVRIDTGEVYQQFDHPEIVSGVSWSHDGRLLACACYDHRVYLWSLVTRERQGILEGHTGQATNVKFNWGDDLLVSYGWDGLSRFWDPGPGKLLLSLPGAMLPPFRRDDAALAYLVPDHEFGYWEISPAHECRPLDMAGLPLHGWFSGHFSPDGRLFAIADGLGVRIWDVASKRPIGILPTRLSRSALFHPDGQRLIVSGEMGIQSWPIYREGQDGQIQIGPPVQLSSRPMSHACLNQDGTLLVAGSLSDSSEVTVTDLRHPAKVALLEGHPRPQFTAITPDGRLVATGTWKGKGVKVWDTITAEPIKELPLPTSARVAFSPDGQWLVTGADEYQFWKVPSWKRRPIIAREPGGDNSPGFMVFSPDGAMVALLMGRDVGGRDTRVRLVAPATGQELATLEAGRPLAFTADGAQLATVGEQSGTLVIWDLRRIRQHLATMKLDWDLPPWPPPEPTDSSPLISLTVRPEPDRASPKPKGIPPRDPAAKPDLIDLSSYYNGGFAANWHGSTPENNLAALPTGIQNLAGIDFDVRGLIQVDYEPSPTVKFPSEVLDIAVGQTCRRLHFLHAANGAGRAEDGTEIGRYVIHFADGQQRHLPLRIGEELADWWTQPNEAGKRFKIAWTGTNRDTLQRGIRLFVTTWTNPRPGVKIQTIDLVATHKQGGPFLVALTAE
jgi:eukaryotic-like serine/threonine-protein kinase